MNIDYMNPRHINMEELEIIALRWARGQRRRIVNHLNIDCFIAGFMTAHDMLYHNFGDFLIEEGLYYQHEYPKNRISNCVHLGIPLTKEHSIEFENAKNFGAKLERVGILHSELKLLP